MLNEMWMDSVMDNLHARCKDMRTAVLAFKLQKELDNKSLGHLLADHLPASDPSEIDVDAKDINLGLSEGYDNMHDQMTNDQVKSRLNHDVDGLGYNEQGKWLVNFLHSATAIGQEAFQEDPRWQLLKNAENFQQQDVFDLMDLIDQYTDNFADVLARQEFKVMERGLDTLPKEIIDLQMNSGSRFTEAYAAAMYIISRQNGTNDEMTPYQIGSLAVASVESSRVLAQYHYGRLRFEAALPKLKAIIKNFLVNSIALTIRLEMAASLGSFVFGTLTSLVLGHTAILAVLSLGLAAAVFFAYSQDQAVSELTFLWKDVKSIFSQVSSFFKRFVSPVQNETMVAEPEQVVATLPVSTDSIHLST